MRESFVSANHMGESFLQVDFDSDAESLYIYELLRSGFINEEEKVSSRMWVSVIENKKELDNAFAHAWLVIKMARYIEDDYLYNKSLKEEPQILEEFKNMAIEVLKIILIMLSAAGTTKQKGAIQTKKVKKRLEPFIKIIEKEIGPDFMKKSIDFPKITVHSV